MTEKTGWNANSELIFETRPSMNNFVSKMRQRSLNTTTLEDVLVLTPSEWTGRWGPRPHFLCREWCMDYFWSIIGWHTTASQARSWGGGGGRGVGTKETRERQEEFPLRYSTYSTQCRLPYVLSQHYGNQKRSRGKARRDLFESSLRR